MKIYHDADEDDSWTEITTIAEYPKLQHRLNNIQKISFVLNDFEAALYTTWEGYDFIPIKIEDDSSNILFRGYLTHKKFTHNKLFCQASGLGERLTWIPYKQNYLLASGLIKNVPSTVDQYPVYAYLYPDGDDGAMGWQNNGGGDHYEDIDEEYGEWDDNTTRLTADDGDDGAVDTFTMTTITGVTSVQEVTIYVRCYKSGDPFTATIDIDIGNGWEGAQDVTFSDLSWSTQWVNFVLDPDPDQTDLDGLKVKLTAPAVINVDSYGRVSGIVAKIVYTGDDPAALDLTDSDGDAFTWTNDQWLNNIDAGIIIRDNSRNWSSKTYTPTAVAAANHTAEGGNAASCATKNDGSAYSITDTGDLDATSVITLSGDNIDSSLYELKQIDIIYNIYITYINTGLVKQRKEFHIEIRYNGTTWIKVASIYRYIVTGETGWIYGRVTLDYNTSSELAKFLSKTGVNYDEVEQIRIRMDSDGSVGAVSNIFYVDYLAAEIYYYEADTDVVMETITDNGASWVLCDGVDFVTLGVQGETAPGEEDGDTFQIGTGSGQVLVELFTFCGIGLEIQSTLTTYISQWYKGLYAIDILNKICKVEGLHWWEDYINNQIIVCKTADMDDSEVDLTSANYAYDWEFEDDCNNFGGVEVYGAAAYNIYYKANSTTSSSPKIKTLIDESILSVAEAKEVADAMLLDLETKQPSIKIAVIGTQIALSPGVTVGLTMERPTVAAADYPIRMIEREKFGADIKTIIYCGLGQSTPQEKLANAIDLNRQIAWKAHTDRLISTPFGAGASFSWSDIGGAQAAVEAIITTEVGAGESIDNAIDTLIATHTGVATAHQDAPALIATHTSDADAHSPLGLDEETGYWRLEDSIILMKTGYTNAQLQAAIDDLVDTYEGGFIYLPTGDCSISTQLALDGEIHLIGSGKETKLLNGLTADYVMDITGSYATVENLQVVADATSDHGIEISGSFVEIKNCAINGVHGSGNGVLIDGNRNKVSGCYLLSFDNGVYINSGYHNSIWMNHIADMDEGIYDANTGQNQYWGNSFEAIDGWSIYIISDYARCFGNTIPTGSGLYVHANSNYSSITGNMYPAISNNGTNTQIAGNSDY